MRLTLTNSIKASKIYFYMNQHSEFILKLFAKRCHWIWKVSNVVILRTTCQAL